MRRHLVQRRQVSTFNTSYYGLSPEQIQLSEQCLVFAHKEFRPFAAQWDEEKIFPKEALRRAAQLGLGGMFVREEWGGSGLSRVDGSLVFEALAQGCTSTTAYLSIHNMCAWMVAEFSSDEIRRKYLPSMVSMDSFSSYCLTEPNAGSDAASLKTSASLQGDSYVLNGSKAFISGGSVSDLYLVMARTGEAGPKGISCFLVDTKTCSGVSFGKQERKLGWNSQPTCIVNFDHCLVPKEHLLGSPGQGFTLAMRGLDGGRLSIGACSIGAGKACFDLALDHVKHRHQFGAPLSANQNIQFKIAEMGSKLHLARLAIRNAAALLDAKDASATAHCAMAKKVATEFGHEVVDEALQLLGGVGYLKDFPVERFLRDTRVHRILEGTNEIQSLIMAREALK